MFWKDSVVLFVTVYVFANSNIEAQFPVSDYKVACGNLQPEIITDSQGYVVSPQFNSFLFYNGKHNCTWMIVAPKSKIIRLHLQLFNLGQDCARDALEFYDRNISEKTFLGRFCGNRGVTSFSSPSDILVLRFYSSGVGGYIGFQYYHEQDDPTVMCDQGTKRCRSHKKCFDEKEVCDGVDDCGDGTDEENCGYQPTIPDTCGQPKIPPIEGNDKIVGGRDAVPGSWPWQVSLQLVKSVPMSHQCGGSLINRQWLVTAAHCFRNQMDKELWKVVAGKYNKFLRDSTEQLRYIEEFYVHPEYKGFEPYRPQVSWLTRKQNDIALVKLNAPVTLTDEVQPVCLNKSVAMPSSGTLCHVTGWGETHDTGFEWVLKQAAVPVVSRDQCNEWFYPLKQIGDKMICAGYEQGGHDSCQGDSGGPLVVKVGNKWQLVGVVSTGGICAFKKEPGIYTASSPYWTWINATMWNSTQLY